MLLRTRPPTLSPPPPPAACRDVHTGTALTSFKGNACPPGGLARLGRDYLVAAQLGRGGGLHFWAWHKDQLHQRCFAAEALTAVAASPDGAYCAAGGASGAVFVWEASSGRLLRTWPAHYKARCCGRVSGWAGLGRLERSVLGLRAACGAAFARCSAPTWLALLACAPPAHRTTSLWLPKRRR